MHFYTNNAERMTIDTSGNVGIGTTTPAKSLDVEGNDGNQNGEIRIRNTGAAANKYWNMGPDTGNNFVIYNQTPTGVYVVEGGSSWSSNSDLRLKTNVQTLASSTLDAILSLNPVTFNWRDPNAATTTQIGLIAQDVQQGFPEIVTRGSVSDLAPDGALGVQYTGLIAPLVKAVQDIARISSTFKANLIAWLASAENGIHDLYASIIHAQHVHSDDLCLKKSGGSEVCASGDQLAAILAGTNTGAPATGAAGAPGSTPVGSTGVPTSTPSLVNNPPTLVLNGNNPAQWQLDSPWQDNLGALFTTTAKQKRSTQPRRWTQPSTAPPPSTTGPSSHHRKRSFTRPATWWSPRAPRTITRCPSRLLEHRPPPQREPKATSQGCA
jgi:hypothetical protein